MNQHDQQKPSNFAMTVRINEIAGKAYGNPNEFHLPEFIARLRNQSRLIQSELNETIDKGIAVLETLERDENGTFIDQEAFIKARHEVRDGVMDVLFTGYGLGHLAGLNVDEDYHAVCMSNVSKFDLTPEDAELTRQKYEALGLETYIHLSELFGHIHYVTRGAKDQFLPNGDSVPEGKWLKSHNFKEPEYRPLADQYAEHVTRKADYTQGLKVQASLDALNTVLTEAHQKGMTAETPVDIFAGGDESTDLSTIVDVTAWLQAVRNDHFGGAEHPNETEWLRFATALGNLGVNVDYRPIPTATGMQSTRWRLAVHFGYIDFFPADDVTYEAYVTTERDRAEQQRVDLTTAVEEIPANDMMEVDIEIDPNDPDPVGTTAKLMEEAERLSERL